MPSDATSAPALPRDRVRAFLIELLQAYSVFEFDAEIVADAVLHRPVPDERPSDAGSIDPTTTLDRVAVWIDEIVDGQIDPRGRPLVMAEAPALVTIDGSGAIGPVGLAAAIDRLIELAPQSGLAAAVIRNGRDAGSSGWAADRIAEAGLAGFLTSHVYRPGEQAGRTASTLAMPGGLIIGDGHAAAASGSALASLLTLLANGRRVAHKPDAPNPYQVEHLLIAVAPDRGLGIDTMTRCQSREFPDSGRETSDEVIVRSSTRDRLNTLASDRDAATL